MAVEAAVGSAATTFNLTSCSACSSSAQSSLRQPRTSPQLLKLVPQSRNLIAPGSVALGRCLAGFSKPLARRRMACRAQEYTVEIEKGSETYKLHIDEDSYILEAAIDAGLDLPHDCKLGVCMTCPAKLISGQVDQSEGMLSEDVQEKGFTLMCIAKPLSDCKILCIEEEELLGQMMHSGEL